VLDFGKPFGELVVLQLVAYPARVLPFAQVMQPRRVVDAIAQLQKPRQVVGA
jgi:hypothetical protein